MRGGEKVMQVIKEPDFSCVCDRCKCSYRLEPVAGDKKTESTKIRISKAFLKCKNERGGKLYG